MDIRERLREIRLTFPLAVWLTSLLLGLPFAIAWALDDGSGNQPFPKGLRRLVLFAATLHVACLLWRLLSAVRAWEPLPPIFGRLLCGYALLAVTVAVGWGMHHLGIRGLTHFVLGLPAGWAVYLLARAMTPAAPLKREQRLPM